MQELIFDTKNTDMSAIELVKAGVTAFLYTPETEKKSKLSKKLAKLMAEQSKGQLWKVKNVAIGFKL